MTGWRRPASIGVAIGLLLLGCDGAPASGRDGDTLVAVEVEGVDANADTDADTAPDGACAPCSYDFCPDHAFCEAPTELSPDAPLRAQDTAAGARGDCALSGSGLGGRNLYHTFAVPAGALAEVVLTPTSEVEHGGPMLRVIARCEADGVEALNRVPRDDGTTALCLNNPAGISVEVLLAVSDYHELDLTYDLALTLHASTDVCSSAERFTL